ncbi:MAG: PAS domain S-box protein [Burkholderiales bacterium]|nr:PAS domain S-box protein [Burkholderiales bacterium]
MTHPSSPFGSRFTARQLTLVLLATIALAETAIMILLHRLLPEETTPLWVHIALDTSALTLVCLPVLWWLFLRPLNLAAERARLAAQAIMDTAGEGIITTDERGIVQTFNRAAENIFGHRAAEIVGQNVSQLMPSPYREAHDGHMRAYLNGHGAKVIGRKRLMIGQRQDGTNFPLEIAVSETRVGNRRMYTSVVHDVSEYKATEAALAQSKELMERIFCNIHSLIAYLDRDFNFIRVNQAYAEADGRTPDFFTGKNHFALYPDAENEAIFRHVVETGEPYRAYAKRVEYPARGITYWDWTLSPIKGADGRVESVLATLLDVTQRELAERERLSAIARFRTLFENAGDAIFIHDLQGRFLEVNQVACENLGYSREELLMLTPRQIDTPEFAIRVDERITEIQQHGAAVFESVHVRCDGTVFPVEISSRLIEYAGQQAILSTARDLTVRRRMDAALRENQENTRALLDAINESALLLAADATVLAINRTGAQRFQQTPESMTGNNLLDFLPPELAESRRQRLETVLFSGLPVHFEDTCAGHLFDISLHPVRDPQGRIHRIAVYGQDITETRRLHGIEELLRAVDEHILQGTPLDELITFICDQVVRLFDLRLAWIGEKKPDGTVALLAGAGPATEYQDELIRTGVRWDDSPTGRGSTGSAIRLGKTQVIDPCSSACAPWCEAARRHSIAGVCSIPLVIRGEIFGAITLYSARAEDFRDAQLLHMLGNIAARVSVALEASFDHEQLRLLGTALATASNAVFIADREGAIEWANDAFLRLSGYTAHEVIGNNPRLLKSGVHDKAYYQALWTTILSGQSFSNKTTERRKDGTRYTVQQTITPVRDRKGKISHFISMNEDISEQLATQARIEHMAHFDALTGLPNRSLFFDRLSQAIALSKRASEHIALLFLDLDRFKPVNDTYGHAVGDLLLKAVAERLLACVRESDTVARIAGDEFTVILHQIADRASAAHAAEKIVKSLSEPFMLGQHRIQIGVSIGIALYPGDSQNEQELVKLADTAMYDAKNQSRNTYRFYSSV